MNDKQPPTASGRTNELHRSGRETRPSALSKSVDAGDESGLINDVADTAFWTAGIRAREQKRQLPAYLDAYSEHLAGAKGLQIARRLQGATEIDWGVSMRSVTIDRMILGALSQGVDVIINLGAGLDARPYRLDIPPHVLWVEADLPEIIEYKNARTAGDTPRCIVRRVAADLTSVQSLGGVLSLIADGERKALVLTEGVLPYLTAEEVAAIAGDLHGAPNVISWVVEYDAAGAHGWAPGYRKALRAVPRRFQMPHLLSFLRFSGWEPEEQVGSGEEAARLGRPIPVGFPRRLLWRMLPAHWRDQIENLSGVALLRKT